MEVRHDQHPLRFGFCLQVTGVGLVPFNFDKQAVLLSTIFGYAKCGGIHASMWHPVCL